ncbi:MAG: POT family MFS transporter [Verrucomicrobiota bacterium]
MAKNDYLTAPLKTTGMPPGVPYIIGNEAAERFSFYGMNSILVVFMTKYMLDASGKSDLMTEAQAETWYHTFFTWVYLLPILGAVLADAVWGKYRTIFWVSIIYCLGHFALALDHTRFGLLVGMGLIAVGAGGIKPCVSANVGDQFGASNQHLLTRVFSWFYFSINFGSAFSTMLIPELLDRFGPALAFGTPGVFMFLATVVFWFGRKKFVHIPPAGLTNYFKGFCNLAALKIIGNLLIPVPFVAVFWGLWYQNFSSWVLQADKMDRHLFGHEWLPAQIQTVNPVFILLMLPLFSYVVYPAIDKVFRLTAMRKIGLGLFATAVAFLIIAWIQARLDAGQRPHIIWQIVAYIVLTVGEVAVSVTHLEFSYTQAPQKMKSIVMCLYLGAISLGNFFTAQFNHFNQNADGSLKFAGASYFYFFVIVMVVTAILFVPVARFYKGKTYIQDEAERAA